MTTEDLARQLAMCISPNHIVGGGRTDIAKAIKNRLDWLVLNGHIILPAPPLPARRG